MSKSQQAIKKPIPRGIPTVRMMALPADTNWLGDIFGGWLMSHADIAGAVLAYRRAHGKVVTVAINNFLFIEPVYIGDIVSFYAEIDTIGNSSISINIDILVERPDPNGSLENLRVATANITYVHIDANGKPQSLTKSSQAK